MSGIATEDITSSRRGRWEVASLIVAVIALLVSGLAFVWPIAAQANGRNDIVRGYLEALVENRSDEINVAAGYASLDSSAYSYATAIVNVWLAVEDSDRPDVGSALGSVAPAVDGWTVCMPDIELFDDTCRLYANFEYGDNDRITRFTIDGVPVEKLFQLTPNEHRLTTEGDADVFDAFASSQLRDPGGERRTFVFWVRQERHPEPFSAIQFAGLVTQDAEEEALTAVASATPESLPYWDGAYVAFRVPDETRFLQLCWSGDLAGKDPCDWLYNLR